MTKACLCVCGEINNYVTLKHDRNFLWAYVGLALIKRNPTGTYHQYLDLQMPNNEQERLEVRTSFKILSEMKTQAILTKKYHTVKNYTSNSKTSMIGQHIQQQMLDF